MTIAVDSVRLRPRASLAFAIIASWTVATGCGLPRPEAPELRPARPNIVILYADDMGYGDLGIQNPDAKLATPNLDRLAREGTRFTNAHSSSGICTPSRYALLTGRYHWRKFHDIVNSWDPPVIDDARWTLPEVLRSVGYKTACIGKWHLGWDWSALRRAGCDTKEARDLAESYDWSKRIPGGPLAHGFDLYFGDDVPNFPPYTFIENDRVVVAPDRPHRPQPKPPEGTHECRPGPMAPGWRLDQVMPTLTERAVAWLDEQEQGKPFFLYFPFTAPHAPIVPSAEFRGRSQAGPYGDFVQQVDAHVGQVLAALDRKGLRETTLVVFTSDNGPEHYAYARAAKFAHRSMGPLRGLKRDVYEGGHRVPFLVRWPGVLPKERVTDELIGQVDLFATLAAMAGATIPSGMAEDSVDQGQLFDGSGASAREAHVHNTYARVFGLRSGPWLLIDGASGTHSKVPREFLDANGYLTPQTRADAQLFDLSQDLAQKRDLAAARPEVVTRLRALLAQTRAAPNVR